MGKVVERKKKKKGRPSLLDLQKRTLREQQQQQLQLQQEQHKRKNTPHSNPNYRPVPADSATPLRRSTRRNPNPDDNEDEDGEDDDDDVSAGKRREKKLKLVLKLPPNQKSSANSASLNSGGSDSNADEDNAASGIEKKRKINAIGDGSGLAHPQKGEKSVSGTIPSSILQGTMLHSGPSTPLPDKKLLLFVLDRLQKKDTYGVFSEPVDPEELPDYHEVIEHPMDFGTVKKKVTSGAYTSLEQFENDIFLICSNAMQYNSPDTIYFRQARSIQELAKKNFENLRQDSDDNEPGPKVVRRGRPPTKHLKKALGRPSLERAGTEFSDATLATGAHNSTLPNYDLRKGSHSDKSALVDSSGRFHGSRNNDVYTSFEKNDDFPGTISRGSSKLGKKQFVFDENRRNTYNQSHPSAGGRESSVFTTFDGERKHLMAVGLHSDYGYARSLARFAANLELAAWNVAAKKIERSLPPGVKFGPGWVGENDVVPHRPLILASSLPDQPFPIWANSSSAATSCSVESNGDKLSDKPSGQNLAEKHAPCVPSTLDGYARSQLPSSAATSSLPLVANKSLEPLTRKTETVEGSSSRSGFNILSNNLGLMRPRPPFQMHQNSGIQAGINGYNGTYGLTAQMEKLVGAARPGGFNFQSSQMPDSVSRTNTNFVHPATSNSLNSEGTKFAENPGKTNSLASFPNSVNDALAARTLGIHPRQSWQGLSQQQKPNSGLSPQQKPDSVPPDLNVRFQSPGSPSTSRADSTQPDLALQL